MTDVAVAERAAVVVEICRLHGRDAICHLGNHVLLPETPARVGVLMPGNFSDREGRPDQIQIVIPVHVRGVHRLGHRCAVNHVHRKGNTTQAEPRLKLFA